MQNTQFGLKIKYLIIFVLCSGSCGKHSSTQHMRIREIFIKEKIIMKKKILFGVPRAAFDPMRERLIGP